MASEIPPPPPGFQIDAPAAGGPPPPPPGFKLDPMPTPSKPDISATGSGVGDFIAGVGQGFNQRVMPVLNAPNRLFGHMMEPVVRGLGLTPPPSMTGAGSDAQSKAQEKAYTPIDTSQSKYGRYGQAAGDTAAVGAGMGMALPLLGPAAIAPGAVPEAVLPTVARALTASPTSIGGLAGQAETNLAAGAGGEAAKDTLGPSIGEKNAETIGQLAGGAAPGLTPAMLAATFAKMLGLKGSGIIKGTAARMIPESPTFETRQAERNAYVSRGETDAGEKMVGPSGKDYSNPATPAPPQPTIKERVQDWATTQRIQNSHEDIGRRLDEISHRPDVGANIDRARDLQEKMPGLKLTTAEQTGYEPLLMEQRRIESQMGGDDLVGRQKTFDQNQKIATEYGDSRVPQAGPSEGPPAGGFNADAATGQAAREITQGREVAAGQTAAGAEDQIRSAGKALPVVPQQQSGAQIREGYDAGRQAASEQTNAKKQAIFDEAGNTRFDASRLHQGIQDDMTGLGTNLVPEELPPTARKILGNTATAETPTTGADALLPRSAPQAPQFSAEDLFQARRDVNERLRMLNSGQVGAADVNQIKRLEAVRSRLDAEWQNLGEEGSNVRGAVNAFNDHYREKVAPNYRQGLGGEMNEKLPTGEQKLSNQDVTQKVLANDAETAAQNLRVNPTGVGRQGTISANLDDLRRSAVDPKTGMIKEGGVQAWVAKNQDRLAADPELKKLVEARDPQALYDTLNAAHADMSAAKDADIAKMFGSSTKGAPRSDTRNLDDAFTNPEKMRSIKDEAAKDPDLDAALKRAVWNRAIANPAEALSDPAKKQALTIAYGDNPQHLRDLQDISDALQKAGSAGRAKGAATDFQSPGSAITDITGSSASSLLNKLWGLNTGRTSKSWLGLDVGLRAVNNFTAKDYERALKTAIYNPEVARIMAAGVKAGKLTPPAQKLLSQYMLAAPLASDTRDDQRGK